MWGAAEVDAYGDRTGAFPEECYFLWIAAEVGDIALNPLHRQLLVHESEVAVCSSCCCQKAEGSESVIDAGNNYAMSSC